MCYAVRRLNQNDHLHNAAVDDNPRSNRLLEKARWDIYCKYEKPWVFLYRDNFSTAIIAFVQVAIAWIEVFCSMKLIASIGETNKRNLIWWMVIQPFAIVNLVFISFTELKKLEMSINIVCMLVATVSSYTTLQIVYLTWIVYHVCSNKEGESSDPVETPSNENSTDKPPNYDTVAQRPPSYEMTQLLFVACE